MTGQRTEGTEALYMRKKQQKHETETESHPAINRDAPTRLRKNEAVVLRDLVLVCMQKWGGLPPYLPLRFLGLSVPVFKLVLVLRPL